MTVAEYCSGSPAASTSASALPRLRELRHALVNTKARVAIAMTGRSEPLHAPFHDAGRPTWAPEGLLAVSVLHPYSSRFREGTNQLVLVSTTGAETRS